MTENRQPAARYWDVILSDGDYWLDVPAERLAELAVQHRLPLGFWERLPWFGKIKRNMWAKRWGANLDSPPRFFSERERPSV